MLSHTPRLLLKQLDYVRLPIQLRLPTSLLSVLSRLRLCLCAWWTEPLYSLCTSLAVLLR